VATLCSLQHHSLCFWWPCLWISFTTTNIGEGEHWRVYMWAIIIVCMFREWSCLWISSLTLCSPLHHSLCFWDNNQLSSVSTIPLSSIIRINYHRSSTINYRRSSTIDYHPGRNNRYVDVNCQLSSMSSLSTVIEPSTISSPVIDTQLSPIVTVQLSSIINRKSTMSIINNPSIVAIAIVDHPNNRVTSIINNQLSSIASAIVIVISLIRHRLS
jgi:hypothetical protein